MADFATIEPKVQQIILGNKKHKYYDVTVARAKKYKQIITGEDINELLLQMGPTMSADALKNLKKIAKQITPAVCATIMNTFNKIYRANPHVDLIDWKTGYDTKIKKFNEAADQFYGGQSIKNYLQEDWHPLVFIDPNAYIVVVFDPFDNKKETAKPRPIVWKSEEVLNYEYKNGVLDWLLIKTSYELKADTGVTKQNKYILYTDNEEIVYWQVDTFAWPKGKEAVDIDDVQKSELIQIQNGSEIKYYIRETFYPKTGEVPAIVAGYMKDLTTNGETFVSPIEPAMPWFDKSLKSVAESDLTHYFFVFPKERRYGKECDVSPSGVCQFSGQNADGCTVCGGKRIRAHRTAQDVELFDTPTDKDQVVIPLSEMSYTDYPPVEFLTFIDTHIKWLMDMALQTIFNSERFTKSEIEKTAYEIDVTYQNLNDTFEPFGKKLSALMIKERRLVATYIDLGEGLIQQYSYPKDFKLKSQDIIIAQLGNVWQMGGNSFVTQQLNDQLLEQLLIDDTEKLKKVTIKQKFQPFLGKTISEIIQILASTECLQETKVLYNYFEDIFQELENESLKSEGDIWFYDLSYEKQKTKVDAKVTEIIERLKAQNPSARQLDLGDDESPDTVGGGATQQQ